MRNRVRRLKFEETRAHRLAEEAEVKAQQMMIAR